MELSMSDHPRYYLRDRGGEPLMGYDDVLDAYAACNKGPRGAELVRAEDGVVLARHVGTDVMKDKAPSCGNRGK